MSIFRNIMAFIGGLAIVLGTIFGFGMLNKDFRTFVCSVLGSVTEQEYQAVIEEKDKLSLELENNSVKISTLTKEKENIIQERDNLLIDVDNLNNEINNLVDERTFLEDRIRMLEDDLIMSDDRVEQYRSEIDMLNDQIFMLNDEVMRLNDDIRFYDDEIVRLNDEISNLHNEIDDLNSEINRLNNELLTISTTLDNATLQYMGSYSRINYSYYNEDGHNIWNAFSSGTEIFNECYDGNSVTVFLERYENVFNELEENFSLDNMNNASIINAKFYKLIIENYEFHFDLQDDIEVYQITSNTIFEIKYILNGVGMTRDELTSQIAQDRNYLTTSEYSYSLNDDNTVANVICTINVDLEG